jgi:hypothetical protein
MRSRQAWPLLRQLPRHIGLCCILLLWAATAPGLRAGEAARNGPEEGAEEERPLDITLSELDPYDEAVCGGVHREWYLHIRRLLRDESLDPESARLARLWAQQFNQWQALKKQMQALPPDSSARPNPKLLAQVQAHMGHLAAALAARGCGPGDYKDWRLERLRRRLEGLYKDDAPKEKRNLAEQKKQASDKLSQAKGKRLGLRRKIVDKLAKLRAKEGDAEQTEDVADQRDALLQQYIALGRPSDEEEFEAEELRDLEEASKLLDARMEELAKAAEEFQKKLAELLAGLAYGVPPADAGAGAEARAVALAKKRGRAEGTPVKKRGIKKGPKKDPKKEGQGDKEGEGPDEPAPKKEIFIPDGLPALADRSLPYLVDLLDFQDYLREFERLMARMESDLLRGRIARGSSHTEPVDAEGKPLLRIPSTVAVDADGKPIRPRPSDDRFLDLDESELGVLDEWMWDPPMLSPEELEELLDAGGLPADWHPLPAPAEDEPGDLFGEAEAPQADGVAFAEPEEGTRYMTRGLARVADARALEASRTLHDAASKGDRRALIAGSSQGVAEYALDKLTDQPDGRTFTLVDPREPDPAAPTQYQWRNGILYVQKTPTQWVPVRARDFPTSGDLPTSVAVDLRDAIHAASQEFDEVEEAVRKEDERARPATTTADAEARAGEETLPQFLESELEELGDWLWDPPLCESPEEFEKLLAFLVMQAALERTRSKAESLPTRPPVGSKEDKRKIPVKDEEDGKPVPRIKKRDKHRPPWEQPGVEFQAPEAGKDYHTRDSATDMLRDPWAHGCPNPVEAWNPGFAKLVEGVPDGRVFGGDLFGSALPETAGKRCVFKNGVLYLEEAENRWVPVVVATREERAQPAAPWEGPDVLFGDPDEGKQYVTRSFVQSGLAALAWQFRRGCLRGFGGRSLHGAVAATMTMTLKVGILGDVLARMMAHPDGEVFTGGDPDANDPDARRNYVWKNGTLYRQETESLWMPVPLDDLGAVGQWLTQATKELDEATRRAAEERARLTDALRQAALEVALRLMLPASPFVPPNYSQLNPDSPAARAWNGARRRLDIVKDAAKYARPPQVLLDDPDTVDRAVGSARDYAGMMRTWAIEAKSLARDAREIADASRKEAEEKGTEEARAQADSDDAFARAAEACAQEAARLAGEAEEMARQLEAERQAARAGARRALELSEANALVRDRFASRHQDVPPTTPAARAWRGAYTACLRALNAAETAGRVVQIYKGEWKDVAQRWATTARKAATDARQHAQEARRIANESKQTAEEKNTEGTRARAEADEQFAQAAERCAQLAEFHATRAENTAKRAAELDNR